MTEDRELEFRGGWILAFLPIAVFLVFCFFYFVISQAFDLTALAIGGLLGLLIGAPFARDYKRFWDAVMRGIGSPTSVTIVMILLMVGMFAALIEATQVSGGFVWLAHELRIPRYLFALFAFIAAAIIALSTGSSIGTMFTAFPVFYPAGVILGGDPALIAGAILSGAILGDNLAPISDTTIISASSQRFRHKEGIADIGGVVSSRFRYAALAAVIAALAFLVVGIAGPAVGGRKPELVGAAEPRGLYMLIPVALLLAVAIVTRDIFKSVTVGLLAGGVTGLALGLISFRDILNVEDGTAGGFLLTGVKNIAPTVILVIAVFGIMGVLQAAQVLDRLVYWLKRSALSSTPRGAEVSIGVGTSAFTLVFGGVNSASMLTFGPAVDDIGSQVNLHPYRRSNVMDCFAMGLSAAVPFLSAYLFIGTTLVSDYDFVDPLSMPELFVTAFYPLALTLVIIGAVATGWGRTFEGEQGAVVRFSRREEKAVGAKS